MFMVARACQKPHYSRKWKLESAQARAGVRPQDPPSPTNLLFPEKFPPSTGFYSLQKQGHLLEIEVETCLRDISDSTVSGS